MKKMLLAVAAAFALGVAVPSIAQADGLKASGTAGVQSRYVYRGVEDNQETPVLLATGQVSYLFVRLGGDVRTLNMNEDTSLLKWNGHAELFHDVYGHELKLGLGTDEVLNSSSEIYVGAAGPIPLIPWGLKYDATVSRSNQLGDVWLDGGISKTLGDFTLRGGLAGGYYDKTRYHNGLETVSGTVTYKLTQVPHLQNGSINLGVVHLVDDNHIVRGIRTNDDNIFQGGVTFTF